MKNPKRVMTVRIPATRLRPDPGYLRILTADLFAEIVNLSFNVAPVIAGHHEDDRFILEIKGIVVSGIRLAVSFSGSSAYQYVAGGVV